MVSLSDQGRDRHQRPVALADQVDVVIGVDCHTDTHTASVVNQVGVVLFETTTATTTAGYQSLIDQVIGVVPATRRIWVLDGARSHGVGLTRRLQSRGERVVDAPKPGGRRPAPRRGGKAGAKSDTIDATHIARTALGLTDTQLIDPRADGDREALRLLLVARRHDTDTRTATVNLLKSVLLTADEQLRDQVRDLSTARQVRALTGLDTTTGPIDRDGVDTLAAVRRAHLTDLAHRIGHLDQALKHNKTNLTRLVTRLCPPLLEQYGVGPVTAARLLVTYSHPGRFRDEAAYASLAGTCPIPASSGRTDRHRLNRGGDRALNAAIHTITLTRRRRGHQDTLDYIERRTREGMTSKDAIRCLKRYVTRGLFRLIDRHTRQAITNQIQAAA